MCVGLVAVLSSPCCLLLASPAPSFSLSSDILAWWPRRCYNGGPGGTQGVVGQWNCPAFDQAIGTYWAQMRLDLKRDPWTARGRYGTINEGCQGDWCTDMAPGHQTGPDLTMGTW